jgi:hypothetical protein
MFLEQLGSMHLMPTGVEDFPYPKPQTNISEEHSTQGRKFAPSWI